MIWWVLAFTILTLIMGLVALGVASRYLCIAFVKLSNILGLSTAVFGAFFLGLGTSLPELANSMVSATVGSADIGFSNIIGSVLASTALGLGVIHVLGKSEKIDVKLNKKILQTLLFAATLLFLFAIDGIISRLDGILILAVFLVYIFTTLRQGVSSLHNRFSAKRLVFPYLLIPLALFSLIIGATLVISTSSALARFAGLPASIIGFTLISIGTTMPELMQNLFLKKDEKDLSMGSTLGGSAIVAMLIVGLTATIFTIKLNFINFIIPSLFLIAAIAANLAYIVNNKKTSRKFGLALFAGYFVYLLLVIL